MSRWRRQQRKRARWNRARQEHLAAVFAEHIPRIEASLNDLFALEARFRANEYERMLLRQFGVA